MCINIDEHVDNSETASLEIEKKKIFLYDSPMECSALLQGH
jgi:hypothetical protein